MKHCKISILGLCLYLLFKSSYAESLPPGCEVTGFGYNGSDLVLNQQGGQSFYLLRNGSTHSIELRRIESADAFMSPPLVAKMKANNWAAFAADIQDLNFQCFIEQDIEKKAINCRDVLEVCQYPLVKFALSNMGNYWVSVDKTKDQVIQDAVKQGIWLKQRERNKIKRRH